MSPGNKPADLGKPGWPCRPSSTTTIKSSPDTGRDTNQDSIRTSSVFPGPGSPHDPLSGGRVKGAFGAARGRYAPLDPPTRSRKPASYPGQAVKGDPHPCTAGTMQVSVFRHLLLQIGGANIENPRFPTLAAEVL
jgi:hypothetical protein